MKAGVKMDGTKLKYWAAFFMLLDHAAVLLLPYGTLYVLFRLAGRLAFPIFAWLAAEGFRKTGDRKKYLARLGLFALISEGPYLLAFWDGGVICPVLFTFFLALGAMALFEKLRESLPLPTALLPLLGAMILGELLGADYGFLGILLVAGLYLLDEDRKHKFILLGLWSAVNYLIWTPLPSLLARLPAGVYTPHFWDVVSRSLRADLPIMALYALGACLSMLPLRRYNGTRGSGHKWFFYWFYPLHILALYLLSLPLR